MNSIQRSDSNLEKSFKTYDEMPFQNKIKLREIANEYFKEQNLRFKEISQVDPEELFKFMEHDLNARRLAGSPKALKLFISDLIEGKI